VTQTPEGELVDRLHFSKKLDEEEIARWLEEKS